MGGGVCVIWGQCLALDCLHSTYLSTHPFCPSGVSPLKATRVIDVSAGGGLCALGCALAGATVVATDIPSQLPLLQANVTRAATAFTGAQAALLCSPYRTSSSLCAGCPCRTGSSLCAGWPWASRVACVVPGGLVVVLWLGDLVHQLLCVVTPSKDCPPCPPAIPPCRRRQCRCCTVHVG